MLTARFRELAARSVTGLQSFAMAHLDGIGDIRRDLEQRLENLRRRTSKLDRSLRSERSHDSQERAQEAENDEVLERLDAGGFADIQEIEDALARIDAGTYGICAKCGEEIATGRLKAVPFTRTCIDCAS